jgi:L-fucose isomerase-like protein
MTNIAVYTLTSELHDAKAVDAVTHDFLKELQLDESLQGGDFSDYGTHALDLIYVRTGGTEGIFKRLLPELQQKSSRPFFLLASGKSNSLAASMEILSYLRQNGLQGEIIHGKMEYMSHRIGVLAKVGAARKKLDGCRLGIVGQPSDWLISSHADRQALKERFGIELVDIPMQELMGLMSGVGEEAGTVSEGKLMEEAVSKASGNVRDALPGAYRIYWALKQLVGIHNLQGFTIRCFDLLTSVHNTGCWALAKLNSEGIVSGCEGDVPALLSMVMVQSLLGVSGFQANPASIDPETGEVKFAHCTIPFNMVEHYEFDTHFESGIGVGIRGYMKEGPVTIFKVAGDLSRSFIEEGELLSSQAMPNLCRTQQVIRLCNRQRISYFLTEPIGNHHVIVPGHCRELLEEL